MKPDLENLSFDLALTRRSVVSVHTRIPEDALTASVLGTERAGHGAVIDATGLVVTIGYLVTEAESVWLIDCDGRTAPGYVVAYDQETGFGLVQALQRLDLPALPIGTTANLANRAPVVVIGNGDESQVVAAEVIARREFAGYWEYVLDEAIFTTPAHPNWGGAAMVDDSGTLLGIGSLLVQAGDEQSTTGANMIVPIDLLGPILAELQMYGRRNKPPRPWIGWLVQEVGEYLVVAGVHDDCPADRAGLKVGDVVLEVDAQPVDGLAGLFRAIWALGDAGTVVPLTVLRDNATQVIEVASVDRNDLLKTAAVH